MSNLANRIYYLQQDIFQTNQQLEEKREELKRLNEALGAHRSKLKSLGMN
ncbi:hypothetical protein P5G51_015185 [Virgibacillus sp. 179-BFC.A HS]|uniref:Uncharacterized protein n=1 Tax=Tigheibacillus jepli TaxID=3035914 RepID=A0ABU5CJJ4_9BACI|nr:hypothetical protein [Virgibacillus sp. 179-BFC.A HS]MDY0406528.1 hypothetical protein [Virgibacillus sp. 179-BFC.A HS]